VVHVGCLDPHGFGSCLVLIRLGVCSQIPQSWVCIFVVASLVQELVWCSLMVGLARCFLSVSFIGFLYNSLVVEVVGALLGVLKR